MDRSQPTRPTKLGTIEGSIKRWKTWIPKVRTCLSMSTLDRDNRANREWNAEKSEFPVNASALKCPPLLGILRRLSQAEKVCWGYTGGGGGIRTHGRRKPTTVFETAPIGHSGTPPQGSDVIWAGRRARTIIGPKPGCKNSLPRPEYRRARCPEPPAGAPALPAEAPA